MVDTWVDVSRIDVHGRPGDIDLAAIRQPVHLWYGDVDTFCAPGTGEWLAARLPTATLVG